MKNVINAKGIKKNNILYGMDFSMEEGEMVAIMGPSGSGKSTFLYMISGMDSYDEGSLKFDGEDITGISEDEFAAIRLNKIGFVFQQMNMLSNLNILDNIILPLLQSLKGKNKKITEADAVARAKELMNKLGISGLEDRKISEVSGGQLQRACICRAMMNNPKLLLADEPTGALNRAASDEVMKEFIKLNREGVSTLIVTHDSKVASRCDKVLYIIDGRFVGELNLGKFREEDLQSRETKIDEWITNAFAS